jgi:glycosyltransferase involved in cell wall biosynthesis
MRIILLYPRFRSIHLKKDPGQIPYYLSKLGHDVTILRIKLEELSTSTQIFNFPKNMKFIDIPCAGFIYKLINSRIFILVSNLLLSPLYLFYLIKLKPKVLIGYLRESPVVALFFYKLFFDRNSLVIIKSDADPRHWFTRRPRKIKYIIMYFLLLLIYPSVNLFIVESPQAREDFAKKFPFLKEKLLIMFNGVAEEYYRKLRDIYVRSDTVSEEKENVILFVGSVEYRKGIDILLKAFYIVKDEFPSWVIKIIGPITSTEYKYFLKKLIKFLNLNDKVIFLGYLNDKDLIKEFLNSSIFVLPSRDECFSIAMVEAAFFGKPIISSDAGAAEYILDNGKAGLLCRKDNVQSLAKALKTMMSSKELRAMFGEKSKLRYLKLFSWKKNILKLSLIINRLILDKKVK